MVWDHVSRELGGNVESPFGMVVDMILAGPFAAPMFMVCMVLEFVIPESRTGKVL